MGLVSIFQLIEDARKGQYGLCYCEAWNLESFQAIVEAAEEEQSPIIVGFNGGFLASTSRSRPENLAYYAGMARGLERSSIPVGLLLNESEDLEQLRQAVQIGFSGLMVENAHLPPPAYRELVSEVVSMAHRASVWVEAQVGHLPCGWNSDGIGEMTDPLQARAFVEDTGIDALGVSIGNVHILTDGEAKIDLGTLERISDCVKIPLVLHGGTGLPRTLGPEVIKRGVVKLNFGTVLKQAYLEAVRSSLSKYHKPMNPHRFLGMGSSEDIMVATKEAVKTQVKLLVAAFGSKGRAKQETGYRAAG